MRSLRRTTYYEHPRPPSQRRPHAQLALQGVQEVHAHDVRLVVALLRAVLGLLHAQGARRTRGGGEGGMEGSEQRAGKDGKGSPRRLCSVGRRCHPPHASGAQPSTTRPRRGGVHGADLAPKGQPCPRTTTSSSFAWSQPSMPSAFFSSSAAARVSAYTSRLAARRVIVRSWLNLHLSPGSQHERGGDGVAGARRGGASRHAVSEHACATRGLRDYDGRRPLDAVQRPPTHTRIRSLITHPSRTRPP